MPSKAMSLFLNKLKGIKGEDDHFTALCPSHDDKRQSLSISEKEGKIVLYCFAGCNVEKIVSSLGLEMTDLFTNEEPTTIQNKKIVATYDYTDESGQPLFQVVRFEPKSFAQRHRNGNGEWVWNLNNTRRVLYHLTEVLASKEAVYLVEGEKDADNLRKTGLVATTSPGGAGAWKSEYASFLKDKRVVIIPDKDKAGYGYARAISQSLHGNVKCIILPGEGKDVSDWLKSNKAEQLLGMEQDITALDEIEEIKPTATRTLNGFSFTWPELPLAIYVDRLTNDATGIISIKDRQGQTKHTSQIDLMATRSLADLSKRLTKIYKADWDTILDFIANHCYSSLRDGGETVNIDIEPATMKIEYLLTPILPIGEPVTLFTAGGKGKSIMADYFAVLVQHGYCSQGGLPFIPRGSANVLILDWESEEETHRRYISAIKRGLGITDYSFIAYRRIANPLSQVIDSIQAEVVAREIEFVILDSQMAATAGGSRSMSEAQQASEYYNLIRSFHCTTLTIDHITKASMSSTDGAEAPYGSIVKFNRSRSQFELRLPDDEEDRDHKEYALIHRKFNLGRKQKPLGIMCDFTNDGDTLIKIEYKALELEDSQTLRTVIPRRLRLIAALQRESKLSIKELANAVGEPDNDRKIGSQLANDKNTFKSFGDGIYGLLTFPS